MKGNCCKCGIYRKTIHRDHIIPKWQGGSDASSNIQLLCAHCHEDKTWEETHSPEYVMKMLVANIGNKYRFGQHPSIETRAKLSAAQMGNTKGHGGLGLKRSKETCAKMSAVMIGNKNGRGRSGCKTSIETKAKLSKAGKARWAKEKEKPKC